MVLSRLLALMMILTLLMLCITWQQTKVLQEERRLREMHAMLQAREAEVETLEAHVARLQSPQRILRLIDGWEMGLRPPVATRPPLAAGVGNDRQHHDDPREDDRPDAGR